MSQTTADTTTPVVVKSDKMPSAIPYIVGNEAAERFNYYGLRAILVTFLVSQFYLNAAHGDNKLAEDIANTKTHDFVAMSYLLPLFGGMVADWFWGKYKTILVLSIVYCIGNLTLAMTTTNEPFFLGALMLIALGAGGIKPCVSANVGDQFNASNQHLLTKAFSFFYLSINAGSTLSILLIPYLNKNYGPRVAFGVPAIAMLIALGFFYAGRNMYVRVMPKPQLNNNKLIIFLTAFFSLVVSYVYWFYVAGKDVGTVGHVLLTWLALVLILAFVFKKQWFAKPGNFIGISLYALTNGGFKNAEQEYGPETIDGIKSVWNVLSVFAFIPVFWALWDQNQSEWIIQATKCDLHLFGITWQAEQISAVNAVFVLAFIPVFSYVIYPALDKAGIKTTPLRRIGTGFVFTALSFVVIALLQTRIDAGETPTVAWQLLAYVFLTCGEILIWITALEYAYTQAPPSMKSTIAACGLLTVTVGNVIVAFVHNNSQHKGFFAQFQGASFYWLFTVICVVTGVLFMFVSPFIKEKSYIGVTEG